jgi:hypothetical protein
MSMRKRSRRNKGNMQGMLWRQELERARQKWLRKRVQFFDEGYSHTWQQGQVTAITNEGDVMVVYCPGPGVYSGMAVPVAYVESVLTVVE